MKPYIIHQKGPEGVNCSGEVWILEGVSQFQGFIDGLPIIGWEWVRGPQGGAWMTDRQSTATLMELGGVEIKEAQ